MCGIVGAFAFDQFEKKSEERARTEANIFITTQLLQATVDRGKDATGISMMWADGNYTGLKMGIPSPEFIARFGETEKDFEGILKLWREYPKPMKAFIGHCRKSSVGNSYDNKNNHPIQIGDLILIHNGTLTNHEKIFDKLKSKRIGDVDSEAIGQLLHHYTNGGVEPFTAEIIKETTRRLHGTYSVLAMSGNNPYQVAQFRDGRPAELAFVKPLKMVYVASEKKFLETVLFEYNKMARLFAASLKLPFLKAADVEFKMLQDDSLALWDLTTPVGDDTTIEDLYTWEKVPMRVDKVWPAGTTTTTTSAGNYQNRNYGKKKPPGTEVNASQKKTGSTGQTSVTEDDPDGLVWSKALNKYKCQDGIEKSKTMGSVVVDVDSGVVADVGGTEELGEIKEVSKDDVENLLVAAAETKELGIKKVEDVVDKKSNTSQSSTRSGNQHDETNIPVKTIEVDMTADAEALKKAEEFIESGLTKYENDSEVAADLEVSDESILIPLALYALANRIKKFIFKRGFITGYVARKSEGTPTTSAILKDGRLDNAEKKIRVLKAVIKVMAECLETRCRGNQAHMVAKMIDEAVNTLGADKKQISVNLTSAFSIGDLKNIPMLGEIRERMLK